MKTFIISIIIGILTTASSIWFTHILVKESESLSDKTDQITEYIKNDDFQNAKKLTEKTSKEFDKEKLNLALTTNHEEIDKIELYYSELLGFLECKSKTDALSKCYSIDVIIRHLPKNYKLKLENVL